MSLESRSLSVFILLFAFMALLVILQFKLWFGESGILANAQLSQEVIIQEERIDILKEENLKLQHSTYALKHDIRAIESKAREELGMIKEDETFYLLLKEE